MILALDFVPVIHARKQPRLIERLALAEGAYILVVEHVSTALKTCADGEKFPISIDRSN